MKEPPTTLLVNRDSATRRARRLGVQRAMRAPGLPWEQSANPVIREDKKLVTFSLAMLAAAVAMFVL